MGGVSKRKKEATVLYERNKAQDRAFKEKDLADKKSAIEKRLVEKKKFRLDAKVLAISLGLVPEPEPDSDDEKVKVNPNDDSNASATEAAATASVTLEKVSDTPVDELTLRASWEQIEESVSASTVVPSYLKGPSSAQCPHTDDYSGDEAVAALETETGHDDKGWGQGQITSRNEQDQQEHTVFDSIRRLELFNNAESDLDAEIDGKQQVKI